jgi:hypothetical protein
MRPLIEVVISLFPVALTYAAWRFQQRLNPPLRCARMLLFGSGLLVSILCSLTVVSSWFNPFPLLADGQGGYSNIRNSILSFAALSTALLTIALALFGRGVPRVLLAGSGFLLAIIAYGAVLQNGV